VKVFIRIQVDANNWRNVKLGENVDHKDVYTLCTQ